MYTLKLNYEFMIDNTDRVDYLTIVIYRVDRNS